MTRSAFRKGRAPCWVFLHGRLEPEFKVFVSTLAPQMVSLLSKYFPLQTEDRDAVDDDDAESLLKQPSTNDGYHSRTRVPYIQLSPWLTHGAAFSLGILIPTILFVLVEPPTITRCTELLSTYCKPEDSCSN